MNDSAPENPIEDQVQQEAVVEAINNPEIVESTDSARFSETELGRLLPEFVKNHDKELRSIRRSRRNILDELKEIRSLRKNLDDEREQLNSIFTEIEARRQLSINVESEIEQRLNSANETVEKLRAVEESSSQLVGSLNDLSSVRDGLQASSNVAIDSLKIVKEAGAKSAELLPQIEKGHQLISENSEQVAQSLGQSREDKGRIEEIKISVDKLHKHAEDSTQRAAAASDRLERFEETCAEHEKVIGQFRLDYKEQFERIESLLPGAASAGLAQAFHDRHVEHQKPTKDWDAIFVRTMILMVLAIGGAVAIMWFGESSIGLGERWLNLASRILVTFPLVWLAIVALHKSAQSRRVGEDYSYKASIAQTFEGFRRQLQEIDHALPEGHPLRSLCENTLNEIAASPTRHYKDTEKETNPALLFIDRVKKFADGGKVIAKTEAGSVEITKNDSDVTSASDNDS